MIKYLGLSINYTMFYRIYVFILYILYLLKIYIIIIMAYYDYLSRTNNI
jgi:hypothetical protein